MPLREKTHKALVAASSQLPSAAAAALGATEAATGVVPGGAAEPASVAHADAAAPLAAVSGTAAVSAPAPAPEATTPPRAALLQARCASSSQRLTQGKPDMSESGLARRSA